MVYPTSMKEDGPPSVRRAPSPMPFYAKAADGHALSPEGRGEKREIKMLNKNISA